MRLPNIGLFRLLLLMTAMVMVVGIACSSDDDGDDGDPTEPAAETEAPSDGNSLSDIPEDTTGITDTEILIGSHMPLTESTAAIFGNQIVPGMQAYFAYINEVEGGVNGRQIRLLVGDDHYLPSDTNTAVRKLVEQDEVFAIVSGLGTAQHTAVFEYLTENKIPDLFTATGATLFTDPITRTTFGYNPNYIQEGNAIGTYIVDNFPAGTKVGMLIQNDDFGNDGKDGVESGLEGSEITITTTETYEAVNSDMTAQVQRLQNDEVDVIVAYTLPLQSASLISNARATLDWDVPIVISGVSADPITILLAGEDGEAEGVITTAYLTPTNQTDHEGIQKHLEIMAEYGGGADATNLSVYGQSVAELAVKVFTDAGQDINRRNVVEAAEQVRDFLCSVCLGTINLSPTDHRPIETFSFAIAEGDSWVLFGDLVTYESTP
jgi:ABC-type branched-subunit amino acid transport system substrate-binding protein